MVEINWDELCAAFSDYTGTKRYFLNKNTGKIIVIPKFASNMAKEEIKKRIKGTRVEDYISIPNMSSKESYEIMVNFIDSLKDEKLKLKLKEAISKDAPFKRFRDIVFKHPDWRKSWLEFQQNKIKEKAKDWLEKNGIFVK